MMATTIKNRKRKEFSKSERLNARRELLTEKALGRGQGGGDYKFEALFVFFVFTLGLSIDTIQLTISPFLYFILALSRSCFTNI